MSCVDASPRNANANDRDMASPPPPSRRLALLVLISLVSGACSMQATPSETPATGTPVGEAIATATGGPSPPPSLTPSPPPTTEQPASVLPTGETDPVPHSGDAADDPAIWVHPTDPAQSLIIGTDKADGGGLATYDLAGRQIEYRADGAMNNVDVRTGFSLAGTSVSLVAAVQESDNTIATYVIDPLSRLLVDVESRALTLGIEGYGGCMYRSATSGTSYFFADSRDGEVEQWELFDDGAGQVNATLVREFDVGTQVEGCVADDALGQLYIGEETVGIWRYSAEPDGGTARAMVDSTSSSGHLTADVEGLTIAYGTGDGGQLIASSQGDDSFTVYERSGENAFVGRFVITDSGAIDATSGTDGIDASTASVGDAFSSGLFVAQDGRNRDGNQNFKLVPYGSVLSAMTGS